MTKTYTRLDPANELIDDEIFTLDFWGMYQSSTPPKQPTATPTRTSSGPLNSVHTMFPEMKKKKNLKEEKILDTTKPVFY